QHAREPGQVGLEPILLGVLAGGVLEVGDHLVDVVFELGDFAARLDVDVPSQIPLGHRGGHRRDRPDLRGQVGGQLVHVVGEVSPNACHAFDLSLATQASVRADLPADAGYLGGEGIELIHHHVDGVLQLQDLSLDVDGDLLGEVAVGHRGGDQRDVAHLIGQVGGHEVDVVGQVLPDPGQALNF